VTVKKSIRRAQAITPFGPGAILDLGQESFVVLDAYRNRRAWDRREQKIRLERLENGLNVTDGFRLPPATSEFGAAGPPLLVQRFPAWLFCPNCRRMKKMNPDAEQELGGDAPTCRWCPKSALVPMRYVAACKNGHLADVDWFSWAHSNQGPQAGQCSRTSPKLRFNANSGSGSSLKSLSVECERCDASRTLEDISKGDLTRIGQRCSGRQPWQHQDRAERCEEAPQALLRSQTAVHFSDVKTAIDLHDGQATQEDEVVAWVKKEITRVAEDFGIEPDELPDRSRVRIAERASEAFDHEIGVEFIDSVVKSSKETDAPSSSEPHRDPLEEEWPKLIQPSRSPGSKAPLRVARSDWDPDQDESVLSDLISAIMLVERLREVRALAGFRRVEPGGRLIRPDLGHRPPLQWLPATEVFGEGIFIQLSPAAVSRWESRNEGALRMRVRSIEATLRGDSWVADRFELAPEVTARFIMLHTFSHLLIRQLTYECGYSGAALRERLYAYPDKCGVLIYTADADSEGSLGGLVRQGKKDRIVDTILAALIRAKWCSNDPICREMPAHGLEKLNHAACHACSLVAETSCTHLNLLLDRQMVVGNEGVGPVGFFSPILSDEGGGA
jgi:hypothetical protein